ncbi:MAG: ATP-dependent helicase HrpB [Hyphomonadaceae bacterium]
MQPIEAVLPALLAALASSKSAVLAAPPGAGKTTGAPLALLQADWVAGRRIILLSPRRIAARAGAARMAQLLGERVGETVGFRVRLESRISAATRIEVVTEGVFTRMITADPSLEGVAAVLFDEFHERSLEADLGLALARDAQQGLREDLRLVVMSATLDVARVAALLGDAPVIASEGRAFPVTIRYRSRAPGAPFEGEVAAAVRAAMAAAEGDALVFLPGAREIERTAVLLRESVRDPAVEIHTLYGALAAQAQDAAIAPAPPGRRKIVLATAIAETSLTIEGVRLVVDAGLARRPRYEPSVGMTRLETVRASQAAITQRAGRAGRVAPGQAWRLWEEGETRALPAFDRPEMLDADLAPLALDLAAWGVSDPSALSWLDPPPPPAWAEAVALLQRLGALDAERRLTAHGRALADLPLPPRLAHMLLRARETGDAVLAAHLAVLLTEQGLGGREADLGARLLEFLRERGPRAQAARRLAERLAGAPRGALESEGAGRVLALAFPDRIAKARGQGAQRVDFLMANGRAASVDAADPLARADYLVIADAGGRAGGARIFAAAPIAQSDIEALFAEMIETRSEVAFDAASGAARGRRVRRLGRIMLSQAPLETVSQADLEAALIAAVRKEGLALLPWDEESTQLRARVAQLRAREGAQWPDWSDAALLETLEDWAPFAGARKLSDLEGRLAPALEARLPFGQRRALEGAAPARFVTPAGGAYRIDYTAEGGPALDVRLQEMFGLNTHPHIAGAPLTLRLTSPAGRPVQTTKDLPGFWRGSYAAVRAEMRGRYPKHPWPEDPANAAPTRRAKPRGS